MWSAAVFDPAGPKQDDQRLPAPVRAVVGKRRQRVEPETTVCGTNMVIP